MLTFDIRNSGRAIELDPTYAKAYYRYVYLLPLLYTVHYRLFRRGTCHLQILKYSQAIADFKKVVKLEPKNDLVKTQLASTQKLVRKIEFEKVSFYILNRIS
jgi:serine/threonine-protein phosphatase 5